MPIPASTKKPLYIAKTLAELNKKAEEIPKFSNARIAVKTAEKLLKSAHDCILLGDEEKAYVLYMRFFNIISATKKTQEYKKNEKYYNDLIGKKNCEIAIDHAEDLAKSLSDRYDEDEAKKVSQKLEEARIEEENRKKEEEEIERLSLEKEIEEEKKKLEETRKVAEAEPGLIGVRQLYDLLLDNSTSVLILDVRAQDQYYASHIKDTSSINVPLDLLPAGVTVSAIEKGLPEEAKEMWLRRGLVDYIVLLDWRSSVDSLNKNTPISSLKDAIFKWDSLTLIKGEPLVLDGGYESWLLYYPTLTTNANVTAPPSQHSVNTVPSLDSIEYDLEFLNPKPAPAEVSSVSVNGEAVPLNNQTDQRWLQDRNINETFNDKNTWNDKEKIDNRILSEMRADKIKNTNVISQGGRQPPQVNRANKPQSGSKTALDRQVSSETVSEAEWNQVHLAKEVKREELERYERETRCLMAEQKARRAKLQDEERQLEKLAEIKKTELRETADLMRQKRRIQQELDLMKQDQERRLLEENKRQEEYERLEEEEREKLARMKEVERKRAERKLREEEERAKKLQEEEKSLEAKERAQREYEDAEKKREEDRARSAREEEERKKQEERRKAQEEERKKAVEAARLKAEQEARLKAEQEARERTAKDAAEAAAAKERALQEAREQERKMAASATPTPRVIDATVPMKSPSSPTVVNQNLPPGWQKVLDQTTGRYGYIDTITQTLHWQPPVPDSPARAIKSETYKVKLKDEEDVSPSSGGMKRSHSSPNIAQMMDDEDADAAVIKTKPLQPQVNRAIKPKPTLMQIPVVKPSEVSAAKVRNLNPTWGSVVRGLTGLRNMGNTCYMNSILQCLSNTSFLTAYFLMDNYKQDINRENFLGTRGEVTEEYAVVIKALWSGQYRSITPRDFKHTISKFNTMFAGFDQQDSQELLLFLMDGLHEDLNRVHKRPKLPELDTSKLPDKMAAEKAWDMHKKINNSIIVDLFQGLFKSTITCINCRASSVKFDAFMYLSLPVPSSSRCSLRDCLVHFAKEEKMTGESRWDCPNCKCKRDAVKKIVIWKLPPILLIHLKRFYYQGMWRQKITALVDFPLEGLNLSEHVAGPYDKGSYRLYAVSNHYGTMEGGHYTAYCKHPANQCWYKYDDHEVYDTTPSAVKTSAAYTLFYSSFHQEFRLQ